MALPGCLIVGRDDGWLIVAGEQREHLANKCSDGQIAEAAWELCRSEKIANPRCVIAPPSKACFFATVELADDIDTRDRNAMLYLLEDQLPVDAESIVADFGPPRQPADDGRQRVVSAVAIPWQRWKSLIDTVEAQDLQVVSLIPELALIVRGVDADPSVSSPTQSVFDLLLARNSGCDAATWNESGLLTWKHLPLQSDALLRHQRLHPGPRLWLAGEVEADQLREAGLAGELIANDPHDLLIAGASLALANRWGRWVDLRRDALAPADPLRPIASQLRLLALAATVCIAALIFGAWYRQHRIEQRIGEINDRQRTVFREAFPETRVPVMLMRHVRNQHVKVLGSRGQSSEVSVPVSATAVLRAAVAGLARDIRFRLLEIDIRNGECKITVRVRDSVDVGKLASGLEKSGFNVLPPATQQIDPSRDEPILTYESTLSATWQPQSMAGAATGSGDEAKDGPGGDT